MAINTRSARYKRFQSSFKIVKSRDKDNKRTEKVKAYNLELGMQFHQQGMVKENVLESDFEPLCKGMNRRSFTDRRLLEGM